MPPLDNRRHESFAQALFEGLSNGITQHDAYVSAGYKARGNSAKVNACRLLRSAPAIAGRIRELQAEAAKAKQTTVETVVDELEAARIIAERTNSPAQWCQPQWARPVFSASKRLRKAKLAGPVTSAVFNQQGNWPTNCCKRLAQAMLQTICGQW
jgi:hypothetical protein